eukprot:CAMPEP_0194249996 /NCGR_PEP_ID=MMETSP0158-20130606/21866_1 /TAXON_ID=33649 /ORGANISM="Thalassionema nitzschioides, Strain L26-B" /LENGTH=1592 /DNA_ID=CAMNT_0038986661 /DNA_START=214 /DNA_END=4992 /DNA_ORIENTATION=-
MKSSVDFASLLAPDNPKPARFTILQPKELYDPNSKTTTTGTTSTTTDPNNNNSSNIINGVNGIDGTKAGTEKEDHSSKLDDTRTNELVRKLVSKTKTFQNVMVVPEEDDDDDDEFKHTATTTDNNNNMIANAHSHQEQLSPLFHELSQSNWEQHIQWEGMKDVPSADVKNHKDKEENSVVKIKDYPDGIGIVSSAAIELLSEPRNPDLDALVFHINDNINWEGGGSSSSNTTRTTKKFDNIPLLLEMGTAGQSIARHIIPVSRPIPFDQTDAFLRRHLYKTNNNNITSTAELSKGSLTENKLEKAKLIAERQRKRAQMAKDKTTRVTDAMDTLQMGPGKGRTITSSLMGPGGTERTGRPSRASGNTAHHDAEYVEQLALVFNHVLSKSELTVVEQRQFHRPKLPRSFCKPWQCQIRFVPNTKKRESATDRTFLSLSTNQQQRIRTEADLNPTEGNLVLLEYCEERPPIQLTKGMASKIVNYFRGDKSRCPVSAGGGDRPTRRKRRTADSSKEDQVASRAGNISSGLMERPPRLQGLNPSTHNIVKDWIGKIPKPNKAKDKEDGKNSNKPAIDVLPEGVTEILHPKVHGPFLGEVEEGVTQTGLINNLFSAPMFRHEPESTDFLMVLGKRPIAAGSSSTGSSTTTGTRMSVVLRDLPPNIYTVGQVEPRLGGLVHSPQTTGERNFLTHFVSYHIAKNLQWYERHHGRGLRFDEIVGMWAASNIQNNSLRQRIKAVAVYDKNTQIWESKAIISDDGCCLDADYDYPGVEALGRRIAPEGVATYETCCAAQRRLQDRGIVSLYVGSGAPVQAVKIVSDYLARQKNAALELRRKMKKAVERAKLPPQSQNNSNNNKGQQKNKNNNNNNTTTATNNNVDDQQQLQIQLYEKAFQTLDEQSKELKRKHEVAEFIYQELCLAPWHLTFEFIDVHKQHHGTGQLELQGKADPSGGQGGYSFLRDTEKTKATSTSSSATTSSDAIQKSLIKKITGTDNDLRKLTMKQMGNILKSFGMPPAKIETLKRWDRVHVIRDYSTKAASDGMDDGENGVGLSRFARGEKLKLSEQKEDYQKRIQEIWRRQRTALLASDVKQSSALDDVIGIGGGIMDDTTTTNAASSNTNTNNNATTTTSNNNNNNSSNSPSGKKSGTATGAAQPISDDDNSDDDDDDDFANALMEHMEDDKRGTQLLSTNSSNNNNAEEGEDMAKDARDFAALRRQKEENNMEGGGGDLLTGGGAKTSNSNNALQRRPPLVSMLGKKVVRQKITKTFPAGKQITTFRFLLAPDELTRVEDKKRHGPTVKKKKQREHKQNGRALFGHAMFEDDDNYELQIDTSHLLLSRRGNKGGRQGGGRRTPKAGRGGSGGLRTTKLPKSKQDRRRLNKRKKELEEADLYVPPSKRNNNPHRSRSRSLLPHVIFSTRLEKIRLDVDRFPSSGPFLRPVDRRRFPQYYEKISDPIDLQTIRDKNSKNKYKTVDAFVKDFLLMKTNAEKYNGLSNPLALEANRIYEYVRQVVEKDRDELTQMELAVQNMASSSSSNNNNNTSSSGGKIRRKGKQHNTADATQQQQQQTIVDGMAVGDLSKFSDDSDSDDSGEMEVIS